MKKLLLAITILFAISTQSFASTQSIVSGANDGDQFTLVAKDILGVGAPFGVTFARLVTGADPYFDILPNTFFDGITLTDRLAEYTTIGSMASMNARVVTIENSGFSGDYNDLINTPSLFSGAYVGLTGRPTIPSTFDQLSDGLTNKAFTNTLLIKLNAIASGATVNSSDTVLMDRDNHAGTQVMSTVSGLQSALNAKQGVITPAPTILDAANDGATNAAANAETDVNILKGLPDLEDALVSSNVSQNDLANKYNALAAKYNDLATKFNALVNNLENQGLQIP